MSKRFAALCTFGMLSLLAACGGGEEEVVYVEPVPVVEEPSYTKY
ncbi:hypothetical protein [Pseudoruegeria sp. SHC-113]|nr:hypothetical protein [Pseudoruegeria sp. SHC-113]